MKILQVVPHYVPAYRFGGPLKVAHSISKSMLTKGHEVHVCTSALEYRDKKLDVAFGQAVDVDGVKVYYQDVPFLAKWGFSPSMVSTLKQQIKWSDFVFIHAYYQFSNWIAALLCRKYSCPYIIFPHCSLRKVSIEASNRWLKKAYLRLFEKKNLQQANFIAFNVEEELEDSYCRENGKIIYNGIDPNELNNPVTEQKIEKQYPQLKEKQVFLFLGRIDIDQKAVDLIVKSFAKLLQKNTEAHLVLAGPSHSSDGKMVKKLVDRLGINKDVSFTGLIKGDDKMSLLKRANVFVLTSYYEGLSIALLEAMYMETAVLISKNVGLNTRIQQIGCGLVSEIERNSIAKKMEALLNEKKTKEMGRKARQFVKQHHSWNTITEDLLKKIKKS